MSDTSSRRQLLALIGAGAVTVASGCLGDDNELTADDSGDDAATADDGVNGGTDDGATTTDDGSEGAPSDDAADDADDAPNGDPDDEGDDDPDGSQTFSDVVNEDIISETISYQVDFEETGADPITGTQLVYGDDMYITWEDELFGEIEFYEVDDEVYAVFDDEDCLKGGEIEEEDPVDLHYDDVPVEETTTLDGEEAYVFEDGDETLYVSATTGYLLRVEAPEFTAEFHSWGEVDPITPPDMECEEP